MKKLIPFIILVSVLGILLIQSTTLAFNPQPEPPAIPTPPGVLNSTITATIQFYGNDEPGVFPFSQPETGGEIIFEPIKSDASNNHFRMIHAVSP